MDSETVLIICQASVIVELLVFFDFSLQEIDKNTPVIHAATWQQKLAADLSLLGKDICICLWIGYKVQNVVVEKGPLVFT